MIDARSTLQETIDAWACRDSDSGDPAPINWLAWWNHSWLRESPEDDGAIVVDFERDRPMIIRKRDGGFLYITDLAAIRHRTHDLNADRILYIDIRQRIISVTSLKLPQLDGIPSDGTSAD